MRGPDIDVPAVAVDGELAPHVELGVVAMAGVEVGPSGEAIEAAFASVGACLIEQVAGGGLADLERVGAVRRLFHRIGLDPTRRRPSSEALARRVLKGQDLYRISNAVDVGNVCSLEQLLPMGLYDLARIEGDVELRLGGEGDGYDGIRKDRVSVAGRPALFDARGPFGAPLSDSLRTSVRASSTTLLLVVYVPAELGESIVEDAVAAAGRRFETLVGARVLWSRSGGFSQS